MSNCAPREKLIPHCHLSGKKGGVKWRLSSCASSRDERRVQAKQMFVFPELASTCLKTLFMPHAGHTVCELSSYQRYLDVLLSIVFHV